MSLEGEQTVIDDPDVVARITEMIEGFRLEEERRAEQNRHRDDMLDRLRQQYRPCFGVNADEEELPSCSTTGLRRLPTNPQFPTPPGTHRFYGDLDFRYTNNNTETILPIILCSEALLDLQFREVENGHEDSYTRYGTEWIFVFLPMEAFRSVGACVEEGTGFTLDRSNFHPTNDGEYVRTIVSLKNSPELSRHIVDDDGQFQREAVGEIANVYRGQLRIAAFVGWAYLDPYLIVEVDDALTQVPEDCRPVLKFRLAGFRIRQPSNAPYFDVVDDL